MELRNLQKHIRTLATLPETEADYISCYLEIENGRVKDRGAFDQQVEVFRSGLTGPAVKHFGAAMERIEAYLASELLPDAKGLAVFSQTGNASFFLPLQFRVPLPNWLWLGSTPNIFHLVELKDAYDRYVVMFCTLEKMWILEVSLGAVTKQLWRENAGLREKVGQEWTKAQYQRHGRNLDTRFIKEMVNVLDQRMSAGGYTHLILAGDPKIIIEVENQLPKHLKLKLTDILSTSADKPTRDVVEQTIASFVETERKESRGAVEELQRQIASGGLAVAGTSPSLQALGRGQVDTLLMAKEYASAVAWSCAKCGLENVESDRPTACPACGATTLQDLDVREAMLRLTEKYGGTVEVVNESEALARLGGVGCLLRYRWAEP